MNDNSVLYVRLLYRVSFVHEYNNQKQFHFTVYDVLKCICVAFKIQLYFFSNKCIDF